MQYKFKYTIWDDKYFPGFKSKVNEIYTNSCNSASILNRKEELQTIENFFEAYEYYYIALIRSGIVDRNNFYNILERLKTLKKVKTVKKNNGAVFGLTLNGEIYINPTIPSNGNLSSKAVRQMIISHELGHIINSSWTDSSKEFASELSQKPAVRRILQKYNATNKDYIKLGLDLVDEVIVQEMAEEVAYKIDEKKRPEKKIYTDKSYIGNKPYISNYTYYGEFQTIVTEFARNLSFLECNQRTPDEEVLRRLIKESFSSGFINKLKYEILKDPARLEEMILMLICMGKIKDGAYAVLGLSATADRNVEIYFDTLNVLFNQKRNNYKATSASAKC